MKLAYLDTTEETPELLSAFRNRSSWVIHSRIGGSPDSYCLIYSNLTCTYKNIGQRNFDYIRDHLNEGLKRSTFDRLETLLDISADDLAFTVGMSKRTLARRADSFTGEESERIFRVALVFQKVLDIFEDLEKARHWIKSPKRALGGETPLEYCRSELGAEEVRHLLCRLEHGVFS
jgi:putative toxin-antitoxin system antitoxin component (TIGR02293 family)